MEITWQNIAQVYQFLFLLALLYNFREKIQKEAYGSRYKHWLILDTGESGYGILNKARNEWKVLGQKRSVAYENIMKEWVFYTHDNAENLKLEQVTIKDEPTKYTAYCNTEEYNTNTQTMVFKQLLYIAEKNWLIIITVIAAIGLSVSIYAAYSLHNQQQYLDYLVQQVAQKAGDMSVSK